MNNSTKGIETHFNNLSDEELLGVIEKNKEDYTQEALSIAMSIIEKRGGIENQPTWRKKNYGNLGFTLNGFLL